MLALSSTVEPPFSSILSFQFISEESLDSDNGNVVAQLLQCMDSALKSLNIPFRHTASGMVYGGASSR